MIQAAKILGKELYTKDNYTNNYLYLMEFLFKILNFKNFMIQAANLFVTNYLGYPAFLITLSVVILFIFIYFYYPSPGVTENFKNRMTVRLATCQHGLASIAACAVCTNLGNHFSTIANCSHSWSKLNYDNKLVQTASCDFAGKGASQILHHVVNDMGDVAYYCSNCPSISCAGCVMPF